MLTALLIMLREGFEAALVVAIVYACIQRIGRRDLVAPMWQGMAAAGALSVAAGVGVHLTVETSRASPGCSPSRPCRCWRWACSPG